MLWAKKLDPGFHRAATAKNLILSLSKDHHDGERFNSQQTPVPFLQQLEKQLTVPSL